MTTPAGNPRARGHAGFTLLELLVTAMVVGTALVTASWAMSSTARTQAVYDAQSGPAFVLAREIHELAQGLPSEPAGLVGATDPTQVLALDALHGAAFAPAILADGSVVDDDLAAFSQHVSLAVYAVADLTTPTGDDPTAGLPADGAQLYRLEVEVRQDGQPVGTFHWWLNP